MGDSFFSYKKNQLFYEIKQLEMIELPFFQKVLSQLDSLSLCIKNFAFSHQYTLEKS